MTSFVTRMIVINCYDVIQATVPVTATVGDGANNNNFLSVYRPYWVTKFTSAV